MEGSAAYLAQEYAVGESLDIVLRERGPVPLTETLPLVDQLADAIDAAARRGLSHGLLHPRDVLLTADGPVITGFGIAWALTQAGVRLPVRRPYSAPERVAGVDWGLPADVFALAAMTHELLLTRRVTGPSDDAESSLAEITGLGGAALAEVFAVSLAADPATRHGDARAFAAALRVAAEVEPPIESDGFRTQDDETAGEPEHERAVEPLHVRAVTAPILDTEPESDAFDRPLREAEVSDFQIDVRADQSDSGTQPPPRTWELPEPPKALQAGAYGNNRLQAAIRPAAVALVVGLLGGFLAGYGLGSRVSPNREVSLPPATLEGSATGSAQVSAAQIARGTATPETGASSAPPPAASKAPAPPAPERQVPQAGPPPGPTMPTGRLELRSTPAGAQAAVNGEPRGTTPLTLREMPLGSYTIRLTRDGYAAQERQVRLTPSRPNVSLSARLQRVPAAAREAPRHGSLSIESRPAGARVFLDNRLVGTTPLAVSNVPVGSAAVRIEQDGYQSWTSTVQITSGEQSRVGASLDRREAK